MREEIETPGDGRIPAFVTIAGNPGSRAPGCRRWSRMPGSGRRRESRSPRACRRPGALRRTPGALRTRPGSGRSARPPANGRTSTAGSGNITPPGRSKCPHTQVEAGDRPVAQRPEAGGRDAHPSVRRSAVGGTQLPGDPPDHLGGDPADLGRQLGPGSRRRAAAPRSTPSTYAGGRRESLGEQGPHHRQEHHHVAARAGRSGARSRSPRSRYAAGRAPRCGRRAP